MAVLLRNRLKYALTYDEVKKIVMQRLIRVDGKVRTDKTYPCGFMGEFYFHKSSLVISFCYTFLSDLVTFLDNAYIRKQT